jgi:hypothetical protein
LVASNTLAVLLRLSMRRKRRGWLAGINAAIYRKLFQDFVITYRFDAGMAGG